MLLLLVGGPAVNVTETGMLSADVADVTGHSCHYQLGSDGVLQHSVTVTVSVVGKPAPDQAPSEAQRPSSSDAGFRRASPLQRT